MSNKTMAWGVYEQMFLIVHSAAEPSPEEYDEALDAMYVKHVKDYRVVAISTDGGGPNPAQRKKTAEMRDRLGGGHPRTVVMTNSTLVRGVITAINWLTSQPLRAFSQGDIDGVARYLDLNEKQRTTLPAELARLRGILSAGRAA